MSEITAMQKRIIAFRDARDWKQFHNPKDLAIALNLEAAEVLEHFLWKSPEEISQYLQTHTNDIGEELADTMYYVLLMAHELGVDMDRALNDKMNKNEAKYSVDKARGNHKKYSEL